MDRSRARAAAEGIQVSKWLQARQGTQVTGRPDVWGGGRAKDGQECRAGGQVALWTRTGWGEPPSRQETTPHTRSAMQLLPGRPVGLRLRAFKGSTHTHKGERMEILKRTGKRKNKGTKKISMRPGLVCIGPGGLSLSTAGTAEENGGPCPGLLPHSGLRLPQDLVTESPALDLGSGVETQRRVVA